mmetsp:Transcript_69016/g.223098  ORF Transcript_69016/g.223098 Transcript_69016/m.223098 type:complete len:361 (-) Transcript_69016:764-1846(-)
MVQPIALLDDPRCLGLAPQAHADEQALGVGLHHPQADQALRVLDVVLVAHAPIRLDLHGSLVLAPKHKVACQGQAPSSLDCQRRSVPPLQPQPHEEAPGQGLHPHRRRAPRVPLLLRQVGQEDGGLEANGGRLLRPPLAQDEEPADRGLDADGGHLLPHVAPPLRVAPPPRLQRPRGQHQGNEVVEGWQLHEAAHAEGVLDDDCGVLPDPESCSAERPAALLEDDDGNPPPLALLAHLVQAAEALDPGQRRVPHVQVPGPLGLHPLERLDASGRVMVPALQALLPDRPAAGLLAHRQVAKLLRALLRTYLPEEALDRHRRPVPQEGHSPAREQAARMPLDHHGHVRLLPQTAPFEEAVGR